MFVAGGSLTLPLSSIIPIRQRLLLPSSERYRPTLCTRETKKKMLPKKTQQAIQVILVASVLLHSIARCTFRLDGQDKRGGVSVIVFLMQRCAGRFVTQLSAPSHCRARRAGLLTSRAEPPLSVTRLLLPCVRKEKGLKCEGQEWRTEGIFCKFSNCQKNVHATFA